MSDLTWALGEFGPKSKRLKRYVKYDRYYAGDQPLAFATSKYRTQFWRLFKGYSDNMCQSVVDVQAERLEVLGFTSSAAVVKTLTIDGDGNEVPEGQDPATEQKPNPIDPTGAPIEVPVKTTTITLVDDPLGDQAWDEWEQESMPLVADQVHSDIFKYGDGFIMADENGVWRQDPMDMAVRYSQERPGIIEAAAKSWYDEVAEIGYLNVYTASGVVKYRTLSKPKKGVTLTEADVEEYESGALPQGIPVVHFGNKVYGRYGISELEPVIPLQDALNKAEMDLMISMEYQAFRQRWVAGVDVEIDEDTGLPKNFPGQHGPGNFLAFSDGETKVGEFAGAELKPYVDVIENIRAQIARVTGIPPYYFFVGSSGATVSGETLKVSESRFTRKGKRQMRCIGKGWEQTMDLVLEITSTLVDNAPYQDGEDLNAVWDEPSPRSESEELDVLVKKGTIGVPNSQLQKEAGYDFDEIEQFAVEYAANVKAGLQAAPGKTQDGGNIVPPGSGPTSGSPQSGDQGVPGTSPATE